MDFDAATGQLSGTPTTPGIYLLGLTAGDKDGTAWPAATFTLTITPGGEGGGGDSPGNVAAIPALDRLGLVLMGLLLAGFGLNRTRPRPK